ncbi:MAG: hypothetical protein AAF942_04290, partial [Pseudomonadota bacterium]
NGFAGVVVSESRNVVVRGTEITGTRTVRRTLGDLFGAQEIGDGVHLSASESVSLDTVMLDANARSGLVVDLSVETPSFREVRVEVGAEGVGAVAGDLDRGTLTPGLRADLVRARRPKTGEPPAVVSVWRDGQRIV